MRRACVTACAGEKHDTALRNLENFWERVRDKRRISDSQEAVGDRLVALYEASDAAFNKAKEGLVAAEVTLSHTEEILKQKYGAIFAGDDPEAEPTLATLERLKLAVAACKWCTRLTIRKGEYALAREREAKEEIADGRAYTGARKRKR